MTLRKRTIIFVGVVLAVDLCILSVVTYLMQAVVFDRLEAGFLQKAAENVRKAVRNDLERLGNEAQGYQNWDAAYDSMGNPSPALSENDFSLNAMRNIHVDVAAFFNEEGTPFLLRNINLGTNKFEDVPPSVMKLIAADLASAKGKPLFRLSIARLPEGVLLYSIRPFLRNDGTGPARGVGLMGRWLSDTLIEDYEKITGMWLILNKNDFIDDPTGGMSATVLDEPIKKPAAAVRIEGNIARLTITFLDENKNPTFQILCSLELLVHRHGVIATRVFLITIVILGLFSAGLFIILINRQVLRRILDLGGQVREIADSRDFSTRIGVNSNDELGKLGADINSLLQKLNESEEGLRIKETQLRMLIEKSPLAATISDEAGNLIFTNEKHRQLTGHDISEMKTLTHLYEIAIPDPDYRAQVMANVDDYLRLSKQTGVTPEPVQYRATTKYGSDIEVELHITESGGMVFRIINDVTHRNRIMGELKASVEAANAANEAKSLFLANMSHEIRTPLNGIVGMAQILKETNVTTDQRDCVETIKESSDLLLTVINDILDFSKIESGQFSLYPGPTDLYAFIGGVNCLAGLAIEAKGLEFVCTLAPNLPRVINCDPNRLKQVLLNLLANAGKFTGEGHVELSVKVKETHGKNCTLSFAVSDTGLGISTQDQRRIFKPFVQVDSSYTRKQGGSGLGLAISRRLINLMGGDITLTSEQGKGSTFSFDIVVEVLADAKTKAVVEEVLDKRAGIDRPLKILVAEDNLVNQKVVKAMLNKMGYAPDFAPNGEIAVTMALAGNYDVILMDVQMPVMDGLVATARIRESMPKQRQPFIISLTAHALDQDEKSCMAAGMNGHMTKPLKIGLLKKALADAWTARQGSVGSSGSDM